MIKKLSVIIWFLLLLFHLTGCSVVSSKYTIGERIQEDVSEQFDGVWDFDDSICYVKYLKNGELRLAGIEWKEKNFKLEEMTVILTKCGERNFINFRDLEILGENDSDYLFGCYCSITENLLTVWAPKINAFEEAINSEKIKGKITKGKHSTTIHIKEPQESLCDFIKNNDISKLFDLENPAIYKRIKKSGIKK